MRIITTFCLILLTTCLPAKITTFTSPDGKLEVCIITDGKYLSYNLSEGARLYARSNEIALNIEGLGESRYTSVSGPRLVKEHIVAPFYRQAQFSESYNQVIVKNRNGVNVEFRAYDSGLAYRFTAPKLKGDWKVTSELAKFRFMGDPTAYLPYSTNPKNPKAISFQATYDETPLSMARKLEAFLPVAVDCGGAKVTLMESNVEAYPGMFLLPNGKDALQASFAPYPSQFAHDQWRHKQYVTATEEYIARGTGGRNFPWRILAISRNDAEMPVNNLVYALADDNRIGDTRWIRPGKVSWDWWNDWGISGVDFEAGVNNDTYKHYIDFAARHRLPYVILDEGWYEPQSGDMLTTIPEIDLPMLVDYARQRGVRLILWCVFNCLDDNLQAICKTYSKMGIAGFKVDFLDRNDQQAMEVVYRVADCCARHHLVLDFHGIFAPTGIQRTYPNILNFEAVFGMEEVKWTGHDAKDMPRYDVTFPFIRGQAGYVDFTPGGMRNATRKDYQPIYSNPLTMGTRCHQLAHYIVHESPLTMLADSPTAYDKEPEVTDFIASLPDCYQTMQILDAQMGEYIVVLRTDDKGNLFLGAETNWDERDLQIPCSFLPEGTYKACIFCDGRNAHRVATDYQRKSLTLSRESTLHLHLAPGGGAAVSIRKE